MEDRWLELSIPDPAEHGESPEPIYERVKPGVYQGNQVVELLREHKEDSEAIQFIADMLEE